MNLIKMLKGGGINEIIKNSLEPALDNIEFSLINNLSQKAEETGKEAVYIITIDGGGLVAATCTMNNDTITDVFAPIKLRDLILNNIKDLK